MKKSEFKDCDIYAARIAALRPFPRETLMSLRDYYRVGLTYSSNALEGNDRVCETQKELLRLMGESIVLNDEGVKRERVEGVSEGVKMLLDVIREHPGKRANELATLIGKSVQSVERYVKALKDSGQVEFRGAPKNGGYWTT